MAAVQPCSQNREEKLSAWKAVPLHQLFASKQAACPSFADLCCHLGKKVGFAGRGPGSLLGVAFERLGMADAFCVWGQRLPPALCLLDSHLAALPGLRLPASVQRRAPSAAFGRGESNFEAGLRSLHRVFRVPECCFIRITVLFFLGFSRRL